MFIVCTFFLTGSAVIKKNTGGDRKYAFATWLWVKWLDAGDILIVSVGCPSYACLHVQIVLIYLHTPQYFQILCLYTSRYIFIYLHTHVVYIPEYIQFLYMFLLVNFCCHAASCKIHRKGDGGCSAWDWWQGAILLTPGETWWNCSGCWVLGWSFTLVWYLQSLEMFSRILEIISEDKTVFVVVGVDGHDMAWSGGLSQNWQACSGSTTDVGQPWSYPCYCLFLEDKSGDGPWDSYWLLVLGIILPTFFSPNLKRHFGIPTFPEQMQLDVHSLQQLETSWLSMFCFLSPHIMVVSQTVKPRSIA